jgi:hypothetical protein
VAVGIESEEIAEGLDSDDGTGNGIICRNRILDKNLQAFPCTAAEVGKKLLIIQKVTVEDLHYFFGAVDVYLCFCEKSCVPSDSNTSTHSGVSGS